MLLSRGVLLARGMLLILLLLLLLLLLLMPNQVHCLRQLVVLRAVVVHQRRLCLAVSPSCGVALPGLLLLLLLHRLVCRLLLLLLRLLLRLYLRLLMLQGLSSAVRARLHRLRSLLSARSVAVASARQHFLLHSAGRAVVVTAVVLRGGLVLARLLGIANARAAAVAATWRRGALALALRPWRHWRSSVAARGIVTVSRLRTTGRSLRRSLLLRPLLL